MAPRPRGRDDFDPGTGQRPPVRKKSIRSTSSSRIQDRRGQPYPPYDPDAGLDREAMERWWKKQLSPGGKQMTAGIEDIGRRQDTGRNYSTSMAANMNSYFNRLMAQPSPQGREVSYEDGSVGFEPRSPNRYREINYDDWDQVQQQFRENLRQGMLRKQARNILEGTRGPWGMQGPGGRQTAQPSVSQMLTRANRANLPERPDIADVFVDPVYGQGAGNPFGRGVGSAPTLAAALTERRRMEPQLPPWVQDRFFSQR